MKSNCVCEMANIKPYSLRVKSFISLRRGLELRNSFKAKNVISLYSIPGIIVLDYHSISINKDMVQILQPTQYMLPGCIRLSILDA